MGFSSLDHGAQFAHAKNQFDASPDLDDTLVSQALSVYQAAREGGGGGGFSTQDLGIPIRVRDGRIEFEIDMPRDISYIDCFPSKENRHSHNFDRACIPDYDVRSDYAPAKPYACAAHNRLDPRPIDERIVGCSSRIRIEDVPIFGCSQRIKVEIDAPEFYLCSAHIRLKPDWIKENPSEINACINKIGPGEKRDWNACVHMLPIDGPSSRDDIMLCTARVRPFAPDNVDQINACAAKINPWTRDRSDVSLCVARINKEKYDEAIKTWER